ncbi:MAG: glycosyltransferase family 4 protein [Lachnospiraceae bacterium]|nr:glycosyltransferase family 4 protein [Lachnospiraceae bacterium]
MKILMISHEYPPVGGGGANICIHLSKEFALKGHQVDIVSIWFEGEEDVTRKTFGNGSVNIYRLHSKRKSVAQSSFAEMFDYIRKALPFSKRLEKEQHYDICFAMFAIPGAPVAWVLKKKFHLPYIIQFGGGDVPGFQDRFKIIYKFLGPAEKVLWKNAGALISNSDGLKEMAEKFYRKKEILVIYNGADHIDLPADLEETKHKEYDFTILFAHRLIRRKGLQLFLPQMKELAEKAKADGKKVRLIVVGDGPCKQEYEDTVRELGITDVVEFTGQKSKDELPSYFLMADVFILPSYKEGMSNVVLEAMSYGLPILMTPCEGSKELIDGNGFAIPAEAFGDHALRLMRDKDLRISFGKRSQALIDEKFLWSELADSYLTLFEKTIKEA